MRSKKKPAETRQGNYDHAFIMENPIPAQCAKCRRHFIDGEIFRWHDGAQMRERVCNEAIRAPELTNCRCFYCGGQLKPLDPKAYEKRMEELPKFFIPRTEVEQPGLFDEWS